MFGIGSSDSTNLPEKMVKKKIQQKTEKLNNKIGQISSVLVSEVDDVPKMREVYAVDHMLCEGYATLSENRPENHDERRLIINARQHAQELEEIYLTYYAISAPASGNFTEYAKGGDQDDENRNEA